MMKLFILVYKKPLKRFWPMEKDNFGSTICSDGGMFGYCRSKIEILIDFGENYGILNNLTKKQHFYVSLLMAPLQAPLVTYGIVIKSQL